MGEKNVLGEVPQGSLVIVPVFFDYLSSLFQMQVSKEGETFLTPKRKENYLRSLPPVSRKQQVHYMVVHVGLAAQICINHLPRRGGAIREAQNLDGAAGLDEALLEEFDLRGLAAAV